MFNYQILNISHSEQVRNLLQKYPLIFNGYSDENYKNYLSTITTQFFKDEKFFNIGIFQNEELKTVIILKEFSNFPAWCWAHYVGKWSDWSDSISSVNQIRDLLLEIDETIFHEMEDVRKLYRWHYAYNATDTGVRGIGGIDRLLKFTTVSSRNTRLSKYNFQTECLIEPNCLPKYSYQKDLILNRAWPLKLGFRVAYKKEQ
jgi:hypothetical protein